MASGLLPLAYGVPVLFGLAIYVWVRREPEAIEAAAVAWSVGWAAICMIVLVGDHFLGAILDTEFFTLIGTSLLLPAGVMLFLRRERLTIIARRIRVPPDIGRARSPAYVSLFALFILLIFYMAIITPPDSTDALVYHMQLPKIAFETGRLPATPGLGWIELSTAWSGLLETQQLWVYLGAGEVNEVFVRPITPLYSALLMLLVFRDARRHFGLPTAGLAVAALFSLNEFASLTTVVWAEVPVALYSYLAIRQYFEPFPSAASKAAAAAFAGMAGLVKYDGLILLLALAMASAAAVLMYQRKAGTRPLQVAVRGAGEAARIIGIGLLVSSPLLLRNLLIFGNPVYPFFFGGVNTEQLSYFTADYTSSDYVRFRIHETIVLLGTILTPSIALGIFRVGAWTKQEKFLVLTLLLYLPAYLYPSLAGSHIRYLAPVIPVGAILAGRNLSWWLIESSTSIRRRGSIVLASFAGLDVGLLAVVDVKPDYLVQYAVTFVGLVVGILVATSVLALTRAERTRKVVVFAVAAVVLLPGILAVAAARYPPREAAWDFSLLPLDPTHFLDQRLGDDWRMWQWINQNTPMNATILTFEARLFYLDRPVIFGADHVLLPTYSMQLTEAVGYVRGLRVAFILDSPWSHFPEINRIFLSRSVIFQNLGNQTYFSLFHAEGDVKLYVVATS